MGDAGDFTMVLAARSENVALVRHAIGGYAKALGAGEDRVDELLLAVTEACTNVIVHAYRERGGPLEVVAVRRAPGRVTVTVRDQGEGIVPRVDSPGLGLGLPVIMSLSDGVEIRQAEGGGTEVAMTFALERAA